MQFVYWEPTTPPKKLCRNLFLIWTSLPTLAPQTHHTEEDKECLTKRRNTNVKKDTGSEAKIEKWWWKREEEVNREKQNTTGSERTEWQCVTSAIKIFIWGLASLSLHHFTACITVYENELIKAPNKPKTDWALRLCSPTPVKLYKSTSSCVEMTILLMIGFLLTAAVIPPTQINSYENLSIRGHDYSRKITLD